MNITDIAKGFAITILRLVVGSLAVTVPLSLVAMVVAFIMRELGHPDPQHVFGVLLIILFAVLAGLSTYTDAQSIAEARAKGEISLEHLTSAEWSELANEKSVAISEWEEIHHNHSCIYRHRTG